MNRRGLFGTLVFAWTGLIAASRAEAEDAQARKAAYHLSDADRVALVLGNLHNHLVGAGGPGAIDLAVVVNGPALRLFRVDHSDRAIKEDTHNLMASGVKFFACANTMSAMALTLKDLEPGFAAAERGGVVLLADLQAQGWAYLRP